jgi:hypothetical protein
VLLGILNIRVIVNNKEIYPLTGENTVVIEAKEEHPAIVVTDGYHYTKPIELNYNGPGYYHFKVVCAIDDLQLAGNFFILALFYLLGFLTDVFILKLVSFLPLFYLLYAYYIDRKSFLRLQQERPSGSHHRR